MAVLNKNGITSGSVILPAHVTQIVDALTASGSYTLAITGALGIGTTSPDTPLMVVGKTSFGKAGVSSQSAIQMWPDAAGASAFYIKIGGSGFTVGTGANPYAGGLDFFSFDGLGNATLIGNSTITGNSTIVGNSVISGSTTLFNNGVPLNLKGTNHIYTQWYPDNSTRRAYFGFPSSGSKNIILENEWSTGNISLITNNGFIGINNYTPQASLDVVGALRVSGSIFLTGSTDISGSTTITGGNLSIANAYPRLFLTDTDNNSDYSLINDNGGFTIYDDTNSAVRMYILPNGNIGIGTISPSTKLEVNGTITSPTMTTTTFSSTNTTNVNTTTTNFSASGIVTVGTPGVTNASHIQFWPNDASGNAYYIEDYASIFSIGSGVYGSGTSVLSINGGNNVGIGKTTPTTKLDVNGNATITGSLTTTSNVVITGSLTLTSLVTASGDLRTSGNIRTRSGLIELGDSGGTRTAYVNSNASSLEINRTTSHPILFSVNNIERMRIDTNGDLGIATTNPLEKLHVVGNVFVNGNITATGTITPSDRRLKTDIKSIDKSLQKVLDLKPVSYNKKFSLDLGEKQSVYENGFIADEVKNIMPEVVIESKHSDKLLSINYISLIPILTKAIQEQQTQIEELKLQVATLLSGSIN